MSGRLYIAEDGARRPECSHCHDSIANADDGLCAACRIGLARLRQVPSVRCSGWSTTTRGLPCPVAPTHHAEASRDGTIFGCPEHVAATPELPWLPLAPESPVLKAARLAGTVLTQALEMEREAADEVERRSTARHARLLLDGFRQTAAVALGEVAKLLPPHRVAEVAEMADGAARGYARPTWALRVVAIASEVGHGG